MTEVYTSVKEKEMQSPTPAGVISNPDAVDVPPAPRRTKEGSLNATPSLSIMTSSAPMDVDIKSESDVKLEDVPSPSQSPTLVSDVAAQKFKMSRSPTPPTQSPIPNDGAVSKSSTPPVPSGMKTPRKPAAAPVQLIGDLPIARAEALSSFKEIRDNNYQFKSLGRSREVLESMTCDCTYEHGVDSGEDACGPYSDCINRLTQVECLADDCRCRSFCQNQRFQLKQYGNIEIVQTEKKGYGLRAEEDLSIDSFIYEYVGDVVNPTSFKKRMRVYAEEGIRHFYFMMLQKDEFIDATKSGGIGRFANHSCNPNCYVAKWTVGEYVRMGIFAKRNIRKHEELTFNYNVDRYGHQAQECYCGEPNCVGFIGGKTQTDIATMDDLYLDALGITDENDLMELKGTKKKKGKKIDDPDFMPNLKAILEKEVPKVVQAIRQTTSRKVLYKLLTRIKITEDEAALRQIMRLRGYSVMTNVLEDHAEEMDLITLAMECMDKWPLLNRNKVLDSKVNIPVEKCAALENETVKTLAQKLLDYWNSLPLYNRIPKRQIKEEDILALKTPVLTPHPVDPRPQPFDRSSTHLWEERRKKRRLNENIQIEQADRERQREFQQKQKEEIEAKKAQHKSVQDIIANAARIAAEEEAAAAAAAAEAKAMEAERAEKELKRKQRKEKEKEREKGKGKDRDKVKKDKDKESSKEKRLQSLVSQVVVKSMSKHKSAFGDNFKKEAQKLTELIAEKEKKSSAFREGKLDALSEEKVLKIKKFAKEHIAKLLYKMKHGKRHPHSSVANGTLNTPSSSTAMETPNSHDGGDVRMRDQDSLTATPVEGLMGMNVHGDDDEDDVDYGTDDGDDDEAPPAQNGGSMEDAMDMDDSLLIVTPIKEEMGLHYRPIGVDQ